MEQRIIDFLFPHGATKEEIEHYEYDYNHTIYHWVTDFTGGHWNIHPDENFSPRYFKGTSKEYDEKLKPHYGKEDQFKIIGSRSYDTYEEWSKENIVVKEISYGK